MYLDPSKQLEGNEVDSLLNEFEKWLKNVKKISNYDHAREDREKRKEKLQQLIKESPKPVSLQRVADSIQNLFIMLSEEDQENLDILRDVVDFLQSISHIELKLNKVAQDQTKATIEVSESVENQTAQIPPSAKIIGRVASTIKTPTTPTEFTFWVEDDEKIHLEIGSLVTARSKDVKVTGLVSEIQAYSDIESVLDSFYAHSFGQAEHEMRTKLPVIVNARVEVVRRSDGKTEPIRGNWPVYFATAQEIREAYGIDSSEYEVLAGFTYDDKRIPVPISLDARYIVGYEAAHINISGASGIATKTSYALFLLLNLLAYNKRQSERRDTVAAIAFNVKEADLMFIDSIRDLKQDELERIGTFQKYKEDIKLWEQANRNFGVKPVDWARDGSFKFFAPMHFRPNGGVLSQRQDNIVSAFNYSLKTLVNIGQISLYTLFDPEDLDEKALSFISSMCEESRNNEFTFERLIDRVKEALIGEDRNREVGGRGRTVERGDWFSFGGVVHHRATAQKILNRMKYSLDNQFRGLILKDANNDTPIPVDELRPGELWVIDITQLSDKGQRLVFQTVVRNVFRKLEERKTLELTGQLDEGLRNFPKHVVIFVDELNKFVPSGREYSALKGDIVEMAARGRSVGMTLIGAQQLASKVDEEVLANTSTFVVGRSHAVEIHKPLYAWLAEGLKEKAMVLDKGWMLLWHCLHKRPVLIRFPRPLHKIYEEWR